MSAPRCPKFVALVNPWPVNPNTVQLRLQRCSLGVCLVLGG